MEAIEPGTLQYAGENLLALASRLMVDPAAALLLPDPEPFLFYDYAGMLW